MKFSATLLLLSTFVLIPLSSLSAAKAKDKPTIWEERAAERLKPVTEKMKAEIRQALPSQWTAKPKEQRRILVFWRCEGFIHTSIPSGNFAFQEMGRKTDAFSVDLADDYSALTKKNLENYDALLFNSTSHLKIPTESQRKAVLDFIKQGKGVIGIHAASDNFYEWEDGAAVIGGQFNGHPWTANGTWAFKLDDSQHTLNRAFQGKGFWHKDEIYQYKPTTFEGEDKLRILVSLDMEQETVLAPMLLEKFERFNKIYASKKREVPVSWIRSIGKGRLFYTNFGHNETTYANAAIMQHMFDGFQYALGDLDADAQASSRVDSLIAAPAPGQ